ncbi:hypothetical protein [Comamonas thiooxydans]|uniref:hypothetical protein n=1 Tax=Comamonas thiooxydans TaxID=363952 RepID=UPI00209C48BC|nr:hypothetical protein [Comamonas thiooxydans]MCO8252167.1 hypothetical protein [Comamonas thiooxydans]
MPQTLRVIEWDKEDRRLINKWLLLCTDDDYAQLFALRERVAPGEVCSIVKLVRMCFAHQNWIDDLPASLVQLMQVRNLPQPSRVASSL